jgi:hypothetical protein
MSEKTNPVAVPVHQYMEMRSDWNLVDTLWGGTRAMRRAGKKYLPPMTEEPEAAYDTRLKQSVLTNYYRDTIEKLVSKPLKQPITLKDDVPASIEQYRDNIDGQGTDLDVFTKQVGEDTLNHGLSYILVDFPRNDPNATIAQEKANNIRPYAVHYTATQVIGWKTEVRNGKRVLTQVRIKEDSYEDAGEFEQVEVHRIRVLEPGFYRLYELKEIAEGKEDWILVDSYEVNVKGAPLDFIPLIALYAAQTGFMTAEPAMIDLANLNITHWQSDSDQRNILHVARVPILFSAGLGDSEAPVAKLNIGATTFIKGQMGSDLKYVEHNGKGIEAGRQDLQDLEGRMAQLGLNMLVKGNGRSGSATATARVLDQSEADSPLSMFARELEQALGKMLDYFGVFLGLGPDSGGTVEVFKDFSLTMRDAEDIKALGEMRARGDISQITYWEELKRRGLLSDEFDAETEIDLLDLEAPNREGFTEAELEQGNMAGDETGEAEGHTHVLQANGWTNVVNGHRHKWEPTGAATGKAGDPAHQHPLGVAPRDPGAVQPTAAPNQAAQGGTPAATDTGTTP